MWQNLRMGQVLTRKVARGNNLYMHGIIRGIIGLGTIHSHTHLPADTFPLVPGLDGHAPAPRVWSASAFWPAIVPSPCQLSPHKNDWMAGNEYIRGLASEVKDQAIALG